MRTSLGMALMLGALAVALTACGTTQPPQSPEPDVKATYYDPPVATPPVPLAAAMLVISPEPVLMSAGGQQIAPSALTEVGEGWFVGPVAPIGEDGSVALEFVEADSDLEALLVPADELLLGIDPAACAVTASDTSVMVTATAFELITTPGVVVLTADGLVPGVLSAEPMTATDTPSLAEHTFYGFVYASAPVEVSAMGDDCVTAGVTADVSLEAGWNWVAWTVELDETDSFSHVHVGDVEAPAETHLTTVAFI